MGGGGYRGGVTVSPGLNNVVVFLISQAKETFIEEMLNRQQQEKLGF